MLSPLLGVRLVVEVPEGYLRVSSAALVLWESLPGESLVATLWDG